MEDATERRPVAGPAGTGLPAEAWDQLPAIVWATDRDLRITGAAGGCLGSADRSPAPLERVEDLFGSDEEGMALSAHRRALEGEDASWEQGLGARRLECRVRPLRDASGSVVGTLGVALDVSERGWARALAASEQRYQGLVEAIPAVVYVDPLHEWQESLYVSPYVTELLGCRPEDWLSDPSFWRRHVHPDDVDRAWAEWERAKERGEPYAVEYRMVRDDGGVIWVSERAVMLRNEAGEPWAVQGVIFDITDRKRVEEELEAAWQRERRAAEHLRALDELKNLQLHAVSHDLRGPITAILGSALILQREMGASPGHQAELVHAVVASAQKVHRLVADLLDLDRLERGIVEPDRRPTDVDRLVRRVLEELGIRDRDVAVEADAVTAEVDPVQLERIVENLVANACAHTPAGTPVWIRASREEDGLLLVVEDAGPGVPPALRAVVFEPFRQGAEGPGLGIGLSLVARYAELHGGWARVGDRPGGGARFEVFLPDGPHGEGAGRRERAGGASARPG